ncbi:arylesterase [Rhodoferax mekongensis]|uniref:arylesterase n=1 Tax=Rhodoferax mekongensis TaxID=3068341 RepID=UPI0028BF5894|nr:arylesterase [Rhodoferax sp. TBRC 17199]MDT7515680.1 arylesterase [Rhodoferax sp. TBRC 17199]
MGLSVVRRHCIALLILASFAGANTAHAKESPASAKVLVLGDSLSAEYGLKRGTGWVALMEQRMAADKVAATVINASISGDTTSGGRSRLPALLAQHKPTVVVIELGGNDALRGLPLSMTQDNLMAMTRAAQASGAKVLLAGMQVPPNYGQDYTKRFSETFSTVAKTTKAALVPFLLKGVADVPNAAALFQADRIHPKEEAHPTILNTMWPAIKNLLR